MGSEAVYKEILAPAGVVSNMLLSLRISENSGGEITSVQDITQRRAISTLLNMFHYSVGIRAQHRLQQGASTTSRGFVTDYLFTLEPHATIEKGLLIEKVPTEKLPSYQNAEGFSHSMCQFADEIVRRQVKLLADVGAVSCEAEREITLSVVRDNNNKLPCIVLVTEEDKVNYLHFVDYSSSFLNIVSMLAPRNNQCNEMETGTNEYQEEGPYDS